MNEISEIFSQQKMNNEENQSVVIMDSTNVFITFKIGDNAYISKIEQVKEVLEHRDVTPYPIPFSTQKGIINLRGSIVPIFEIENTTNNNNQENKRMVIFELEERTMVGLICSSVKRIYIPELTEKSTLTNGDVVTFEGEPIKFVDISTLLETEVESDNAIQ
ncbi:MAG: chemotaxis protein CheW [Bacteriovoracaceae bacterium]|nr:chemotaxis protein CheW [Bacteriovoracaceae bacterium]